VGPGALCCVCVVAVNCGTGGTVLCVCCGGKLWDRGHCAVCVLWR
jgi:hypothetical protein